MIIPEEDKVFSVGELNGIIKEMLEGTFGDLKIKGEISNYKKAASGHSYFNLKDDSGIIAAVFFKFNSDYCNIPLKDGLLVTVKGKLTCYPKQGQYQIVVKSVTGDEQGNLYAQFEALKLKLQQEGLFGQSHKKPIPKYPKLIGVVSSPSGAVIRDIISVISRRSAWPYIILAPASVQGDKAPAEIIKALNNLQKLNPKPDVILLARGGGSMEDLWAFNNETLAREIFKSKIPVISCVGHETDFTIADFVADLRAPTPSAGAEIVSADKDELKKNINSLTAHFAQSFKFIYGQKMQQLDMLLNCPAFKRPETIWELRYMELDRLTEKLLLTPKHLVALNANRLALNSQKLMQLPAALSVNAENKLQLLKASLKNTGPRITQKYEGPLERLSAAMLNRPAAIIQTKQASLNLLTEKLNALNPSAVLSRGFAIVRSAKTNKIVKEASQVKDGSLVEITLEKDKIKAVVTEGEYLF